MSMNCCWDVFSYITIYSELEGTSPNYVAVTNDITSQFHGKKKDTSTVSDDDQIEYKAGWVVRKYLFDRDGKQSKSILLMVIF